MPDSRDGFLAGTLGILEGTTSRGTWPWASLQPPGPVARLLPSGFLLQSAHLCSPLSPCHQLPAAPGSNLKGRVLILRDSLPGLDLTNQRQGENWKRTCEILLPLVQRGLVAAGQNDLDGLAATRRPGREEQVQVQLGHEPTSAFLGEACEAPAGAEHAVDP